MYIPCTILLIIHTDNKVFDDFWKFSNHFPKISKIIQKLCEGHTKVSEHFLKIAGDF